MIRLLLLLLLATPALAQRDSHWRPATEAELKQVIPARAPVVDERIETESRTASGISDGRGHVVAGVLLITAGYSANGKYSYFLLTQVPIRIGSTVLAPGNYLIGWTRGENELHVTLSEASTGKSVVEATAVRNPAVRHVESFHISPPDALSVIQFGRFTLPYSLP
ncbi:MAG TPA: hypothetical protein VNW54_01625 [Granulicella sp.]|nr:hypothetical protein [Granulicella sp.]